MKKRIIVVSLLLWSSVLSAQPDFSKYEKDMKGPPVMFEITAYCDEERLSLIESKLKVGEEKVFFYNYTIFLFFKDHKLNKVDVGGMKFSGKVKDCIIQEFFKASNPNGEFPEKGMTPIEIAFPAIIVPKKEK